MLKLLLLRHAESLGNQAGQMEGWQSTPLSDQGWQQATALGQRLVMAGWQPTHIYCSPLRRAAETLQGMAAQFGWLTTADPAVPGADGAFTALQLPQPLIWSEELKEYQNGIFQGLTWAEAQQRYPDLCQRLETSPDWLPIPGAETLEAGRARATRFVEAMLERHQDGDRIWVISHHWLLQHLISSLLGCDRTWGLTIPPTALFEFSLDRQRWQTTDVNRWNSELWQIESFNDCQHLHRSL